MKARAGKNQSAAATMECRDTACGEHRLDTGWSWVILIASFTSFGILLGQMYAFNIYFVVFLRDFEESRSDTAWVGSLNLAVLQIGAIFCGLFKKRLGARWTTMLGGFIAAVGYVTSSFAVNVTYLMFTYGIVMGFGFSMCLCGCLDAVNLNFRRYLFLATGVSFAGGGLGLVACGFLIQWLLDEYGWRGGMLLQAGLALQICVLGALFFPQFSHPVNIELIEKEKSITGNGTMSTNRSLPRTMTWRQRCTNQFVCMLVSAGFLQGIGVFSMYIVYKDMAIFMGFEPVFPTTMLALGIGNTIGRAIAGLVMYHMTSPILFFSGATLLCAVVVIVQVFNTNPAVFIFLGGTFGFAHGGFTSAIPITVNFMFGQAEFSNTFGYMLFYAGIGTILGAPLSGLLTDLTGSYTASLLMSCSFLTTAGLLLFILSFCHARANARRLAAPEVDVEKLPPEMQPFTTAIVEEKLTLSIKFNGT